MQYRITICKILYINDILMCCQFTEDLFAIHCSVLNTCVCSIQHCALYRVGINELLLYNKLANTVIQSKCLQIPICICTNSTNGQKGEIRKNLKKKGSYLFLPFLIQRTISFIKCGIWEPDFSMKHCLGLLYT